MALFFSDDFIHDVSSANDIVDVISSYVALKKAGRNMVGLCPFHQEKTPSFSVSPKTVLSLFWLRRWRQCD